MTDLRDYRDTPGCTAVLLTPTLAAEWLADGTATSAKLMADGDWQAGSLVSIYADGRLRDGHRRDGCAVAARRTTPRAAAAAEA